MGAFVDDDGGNNTGAIYTLLLNADGTVKSSHKVSDLSYPMLGLSGVDYFGGAIVALGDLDGDGTEDIAVSATQDDDGGFNRGAFYVLFLNNDGSVKNHQKVSATTGGFTGALGNFNNWSSGLANLGDIDGDGVIDLAVGHHNDDDGGTNRGSVWILFMNTDGTVKSHQKISSSSGNLGVALDNGDAFGSSVSSIGDLDADGIADLVVGARLDDDGATDQGAIYLLLLNQDGTVKTTTKISSATDINLAAALDAYDQFGSSIISMGDLDGDQITDLAVGAPLDDDSAGNGGAIYLLFMDSNGSSIKSVQKVTVADSSFDDRFGTSVAKLGDINGDGLVELGVGVPFDDDGASGSGSVFNFFLNPVY